jgi:hypothetical protein
MKYQCFSQKTCILFALSFFATSCSPSPHFWDKDTEMIKQFSDIKNTLNKVIKECKALKPEKRGSMDPTIHNHYDTCPIPKEVSTKYDIKFIAIEQKLDAKRYEELKESMGKNFDPYQGRVLIATNYSKNAFFDIHVREKGYLYSTTPLKKSNIVDTSLDPIVTAEYTTPDGPRNLEVWRYRQIEPHWYIYFRFDAQQMI